MADTTIRAGGTGPILPTQRAAAGGIPDAGAPAGGNQPAGNATVQGDQANATAAVDWDLTDVNVENIDINEFKALDGMLQNFLQDGKLTQAEFDTYDKTRVFYAEGATEAPETPPAPEPHGGGHEVPEHPPAPTTAWEVGTANAAGTKFSSVGDPHETTGDGLKFDNMQVGDFVKLQSASGDFQLQTRQEPWSKNPKATVNTMAAVKSGNNTVVYDGKSNTLSINGQAQNLQVGQKVDLPGGGSVTRTANGYAIESAAGDKVNVADQGEYIDITGEVGPNRKDGEIRGSLGEMDADASAQGDLLGRSGTKDFGNDVDGFIEEWRAKPGESLLPGDPPGGGVRDEMEAKAKAEDEKLWKSLDITEDGWLSGTEVKDYAKYDLDNDGEITKAEFMSGRETERIAERDFMLRDINADNYLSGNEIPADLRKYDKDGNGRLTKEEYIAGRLAERKLQAAGGGGAPVGGGGNNGGGAPVGGGANPGGVQAPDFSKIWEGFFSRVFGAKDRNDDGYLTRGEISRKNIRRMDKDNDGKVSKDEYNNYREKQWQKRFDKLDKNNDGNLSANEMRGIRHRDKDGDGKITQEEFMAGRAEDAERNLLRRLDRRFSRLDENNDNSLTGQWHVNRFDKDNDGKVSREEYIQGHIDPKKPQ